MSLKTMNSSSARTTSASASLVAALGEVDALNRLATTVGNLQTLLELPCRIHKTPLVFPLLARLVVSNLPRLVKGRKPGSLC